MILFKFVTISGNFKASTGYIMAPTMTEATDWVEGEVGFIDSICKVSERAFICLPADYLSEIERRDIEKEILKNDRPGE